MSLDLWMKLIWILVATIVIGCGSAESGPSDESPNPSGNNESREEKTDDAKVTTALPKIAAELANLKEVKLAAEGIPTAIEPLVERLGELPGGDVKTYLSECLPQSSYRVGDGTLLSAKDILEMCSAIEAEGDLTPLGFFPIGNKNGYVVMASIHNNHVYEVHALEATSAEGVVFNSTDMGLLADFLKEAIAEAKEMGE